MGIGTELKVHGRSGRFERGLRKPKTRSDNGDYGYPRRYVGVDLRALRTVQFDAAILRI